MGRVRFHCDGAMGETQIEVGGERRQSRSSRSSSRAAFSQVFTKLSPVQSDPPWLTHWGWGKGKGDRFWPARLGLNFWSLCNDDLDFFVVQIKGKVGLTQKICTDQQRDIWIRLTTQQILPRLGYFRFDWSSFFDGLLCLDFHSVIYSSLIRDWHNL